MRLFTGLLPFLRKRKCVVLFLALITTVSVLWTYWIRYRFQLELEGVQSTRNSPLIIPQNHPEINGLRIGGFSQEKELDVWKNELSHPVTRKSKVANDIRDKGLLRRLQELERKKSQRQSQILLISNGNYPEEHYVQTIREAFDALGYKVVLLRHYSEITSSMKQVDGVWCLHTSAGENASSDCFLKNRLGLNIQKMSPVPGLEKLLLRNDGFCYLISAVKQIPALLSKVNLSPPCYVLPAQWDSFLHETEKGRSQSFTLKSLGSDVTPVHKWGATDTKRMEGLLEAVLQLHPLDVLSIEGKAFIMQVYVLVTSVSPVRVYRHSEGHILFADNGPDILKKWNLAKFLGIHFGADKTNEATERMDELIVKLLLILEPSLFTYFTSLSAGSQVFRCKGCFQPLQFSFAFSPVLDPFILEVKAVAFEEVSPGVIQDTVNLLFNASSVQFSHDIHQTLEVLRRSLIVKGRHCEKVKGKCLTDDLLEYLLETKEEALHKGNFKLLYPTSDDVNFKPLMHDLWDTEVELHYNPASDMRTSDVHDILTAFVAQKSSSSSEHKVGVSNPRLSGGSVKNVMCNNDADPVLMQLRTRPTVVLTPEFNSNVLTYHTTVSFDTMVLQIWGKASSCRSVVRINTNYEDNQAANHSLGVGWNKFSLHLVDTSQSNAFKVVNKYDVFVFRKRRSETEDTFDKDSSHQVCVHHQECSLKVFPSIPCGLEKLSETTWWSFVQKQSELPVCKAGQESGRWVLPCASCDDANSCYWREAVWTPYACRYSVLSRDDAKQCLANKKILFVGDSTNRGIMYYLMEKLNGSLRKWEKTHTMKIYSDELNGGRTSVSFAYYPQFWLPDNMRPVFVKALYQLIARFLPLENNSNTILVVGGVQWMDASHITATSKALTSLGLNGIKVIVKSLGSGFHLPIPGLPRYDLAGQRRTAERNQQVISAAKRLGYQVVDTFGMTVSRYKDFMMGNCGCHFHKVVNMKSLMKEEDEVPSPLLDNMDKYTDQLPRYHVIGPINSVYSEEVINRICS